MVKKYHIPNYQIHNFFRSLTKVTAVAAFVVSGLVGSNMLYQYRNALYPTFDESKEKRIDCDPRAPKASFPSEYTPFAQIINDNPLNCDSSGHGVCMIQSCTIRTHSHAGTHADQPKHFISNPSSNRFPDECYNGEVLFMNISEYLDPKDPKIDEKLLQFVMDQFQSMKMFQVEAPFLSTVVNRFKNRDMVKRVIFKTFDGVHNEYTTLESPNSFTPYFTPDGADFLVKNFPDLRMVGIDAISVDHPKASPIAEHSHGVFWKNQVAIIENLRLNDIDRNLQIGKIRTFWNPYQVFEDSMGCIVTYTPVVDPLERLSRGARLDFVLREKDFKKIMEST